jgi:hypothetical protein
MLTPRLRADSGAFYGLADRATLPRPTRRPLRRKPDTNRLQRDTDNHGPQTDCAYVVPTPFDSNGPLVDICCRPLHDRSAGSLASRQYVEKEQNDAHQIKRQSDKT